MFIFIVPQDMVYAPLRSQKLSVHGHTTISQCVPIICCIVLNHIKS